MACKERTWKTRILELYALESVTFTLQSYQKANKIKT